MNTEKEIMSLLWNLFNKMIWLNEYSLKNELSGYKPSEIHCIDYIGRNENCNVTKLADTFYMTRGAISKLTKKLMEKGLIESRQKPDNRKEIFFYLTEKGQEIFSIHERLHAGFQERDNTVFEQMSQSEIESVLRFAHTYNEHLETEISRLGFEMKSAGIDNL